MKKTIIFGHRGYPALFPENSLEGFKYSVENHIEGLEFDVHLTKDQVPVVIHDEQIDRTTNGHGYVNTFTLRELRNFRLWNHEPIPTLKEVLNILKNYKLQINIEFKTNVIHYHDIEKIVLELVEESHLKGSVFFSSFNLQTLINCYKLDHNNDYFALRAFYLLSARSFIKNNHLSGLHLHHYQYIPNVVQRIWTIDNDYRAMKLFKKGVDGIFTNNFIKMQRLRDNFLYTK